MGRDADKRWYAVLWWKRKKRRRRWCSLTLEVNGQTAGNDQQGDSVEEHLDESETQSPVGYVVAAGHVTDDLQIISQQLIVPAGDLSGISYATRKSSESAVKLN